MSIGGFRETAELQDLEGNKIQSIQCREASRKNVTSSFMGAGKINTSQTLDLITRNVISDKAKPGVSRVIYNGKTYLLVSLFSKDLKPIKGYIKDFVTVLALQ